MTTARRGRIAASIAAAILLALAPVACRKEEAEVEEEKSATTEDGGAATDQGQDDTVANVGEDRFKPELAALAPALDGAWRTIGADPGAPCARVVFALNTKSIVTNENSVTYEPTPMSATDSFDLYQLDDNGLGGTIDSGPFPECIEGGRKTTFVARPSSNPDILDIRWMCTEADGTLVRNETFQYERGSCPDSIVEIPGEGEAAGDGGASSDAGGAGGEGGSMSTTLNADGTVTYESVPADDRREPSPLCKAGETYTQYVAPPEACARCEESCRQQCEQLGATLLGSCQLCDQSPDGGTCGHCLKVCLFPEQYQ